MAIAALSPLSPALPREGGEGLWGIDRGYRPLSFSPQQRCEIFRQGVRGVDFSECGQLPDDLRPFSA